VSMVWLFFHFATTTGVFNFNWTMFSGISVDEIAIILIYFFLVLIFAGVIKDFFNKKVDNALEGLVYPSLAIIGASTAIYGGFLSPNVAIYLGVSIVGILAGLLVKPKSIH